MMLILKVKPHLSRGGLAAFQISLVEWEHRLSRLPVNIQANNFKNWVNNMKTFFNADDLKKKHMISTQVKVLYKYVNLF